MSTTTELKQFEKLRAAAIEAAQPVGDMESFVAHLLVMRRRDIFRALASPQTILQLIELADRTAAQGEPSQFGSPELQQMIVNRAIEVSKACSAEQVASRSEIIAAGEVLKRVDDTVTVRDFSSAEQVASSDAVSERESRFEESLGRYWALAYSEGESGVSHGDEANEVLHQLRMLFRAALQHTAPSKAGELPTLPKSLLDLIGEYGMARTDGLNELDVQHRWLTLIDGIKDYAFSCLQNASRPSKAGEWTDDAIYDFALKHGYVDCFSDYQDDPTLRREIIKFARALLFISEQDTEHAEMYRFLRAADRSELDELVLSLTGKWPEGEEEIDALLRKAISQASAKHPLPAQAQSEDARELRQLIKDAFEFTKYAACIKWSDRECNSKDWLDGFEAQIEGLQDRLQAAIAASREGK